MKRLGLGICMATLALGLACGDDDNGTPDGGDTTGDTTGGCTRTDECPHGSVCASSVCELRLPTLDETGADMSCLGNNPRPQGHRI